jgi:hypothetical protein
MYVLYLEAQNDQWNKMEHASQINNLHFKHIHELNKKIKIAIETKINFYHSSVIRIKYPPI